MHFFAAVSAALLATSAAATVVRRKYCDDTTNKDATVFDINGFTTRKYDGNNVATLFFNIAATNGGTLDFQCVPYDPATKAGTQAFENTKVYACGENSFFSFSYNVTDTKLFLFQNIDATTTIGGNTETGDPICRAGGSSVNDLICTVPEIVNLSISLSKLG